MFISVGLNDYGLQMSNKIQFMRNDAHVRSKLEEA